DRPRPVAGPGEVLVDLAACGVCGTDLEKLRGNYRASSPLGHEPVGRVAVIGPDVTTLDVGDRVFVHHHIPCLTCDVCRRGDVTFCAEYSKSNLDPGGFAETFRVSADHVRRGAALKLDPSVRWLTGTLLEPAGCALTALKRVGFHPGDSVFIVGLGPVGLLYARLARALGARWVGGAELSADRRLAAVAGGADVAVDPRDEGAARTAVDQATGGGGVDLAVVATGAPVAVSLATGLARRGGTLNLFGLPEAGSRLGIELQELYLRGLRVIPTYATTEPDIAEVHAMLVARRLSVEGLVTHHFALEDLTAAFRVAAEPQTALKVAVTGPAFSAD
ncbi:MAG TPA: alcohol dehydrogenase catalytic domain-containing protein, partial [Thermoplasmata archaeon]|nr:alcohol dehydrogenase catalytic domain-containing protein [Thermoplasmata archaeon]